MRGIEQCQEALGLAKGVTAEAGDLSCGRAGLPPGVDLCGDLGLPAPAEDGQAKRALGDEMMAAYWREGGRQPVIFKLVVPRHHPDLSFDRHADLRRARNVPGRMKGNLGAPDLARFTVRDGLEADVAQSVPDHRRGNIRAEIVRHSGPGMICMPVGQKRAGHAPPGVDVEIPCGAINAAICEGQNTHAGEG